MAWNAEDVNGSKLISVEKSGVEDEDLCGLAELLRSNARCLGKGTFATTYMAELPSKNKVAVKRLKGLFLSEFEFEEKVRELGRMDHENLLCVKAYCCHQNERLVLYDYKHMASLTSALHGQGIDKVPLSWEARSKIAYGIARGIDYLHSQGSDVCHGNIRSSNVFLNKNHDVKISEYGLANLLPFESKHSPIAGYCAPEVTNVHDVSQKSDVYSFGVLLLEMLTGKAPLGILLVEKGIDLPKWVRSMFQEKPIVEVFDKTLHKYEGTRVGEQMVQLLQVALCCTFQYQNKRPSMAAVTKTIKEICKFESI